MNKTAIKNFAIWARRKLISDITYKARMLGITDTQIAQPLPQSTEDLQFFDIGTKDYTEVIDSEIAQRNALIAAIKQKERDINSYKAAFEYIVEEVAYTWFNRLIAIRFMEVNDYLPSGIRVLSSENADKAEPDFVTKPFETDLEFTSYEQDRIIQLKDENKLDELFRMLFIKQCNKLHDILPELFETTNDYTELLLTISFTDSDGVVSHLIHDIDEDEFNVEKEGQVEIIGWLYQYYNTEPKDKVFANLKKNIKISKENIPAATQLFTPDWIVRYMVENSLGRLYCDYKQNNLQDAPDLRRFEALKSEWKYYLDEAEQEPEVQAKLDEMRQCMDFNPENIKFIDPCMGSGHILVYAFDVLMQIYDSYGYTTKEAVANIVEKNLYGLDIDKRAAQLAYFAIMMKARQYDRRFLTRGITPNLSHFQNPPQNADFLDEPIKSFVKQFENADTYGSLIKTENIDGIEETVKNFESVVSLDLNQLNHLVKLSKILSQKYDVVCTNPPYMGGGGMNGKLSDFVKKNYPDSKSDLFACFMQKADAMVKSHGFTSLITMESWMFLSSFESLRKKISQEKTIINMVHMPYLGKGGTSLGINFGTAAVIMQKDRIKDYLAQYEYTVYYECDENGVPFIFPTKNERWSTAKQENFSKLPGSPVAYWVSEAVFKMFELKQIEEVFIPKFGMSTGDGERFIRLWYEEAIENIAFSCENEDDFNSSKKEWCVADKGGNFRRWYGNKNFVIWWKDNGVDIKNHKKSAVRSPQFFFRPHISWTLVSSGTFSARFFERGYLLDTASNCLYFNMTKERALYALAYLNSSVASYVLNLLNPTINMSCGVLGNLPYVESNINTVAGLAGNNIFLSKQDWDSFETSWDFKKHPLLEYARFTPQQIAEGVEEGFHATNTLEDAYNDWAYATEKRFNQLKANEEELNRIFIDIYGLQDELTPEVEDKDVTVRKADLQRDIKSLISYAVGCMFGRYSLDYEGLAYAGGEWDSSKYSTFIPDVDNCIPITDEEYFEDDIVGLFCAWLKKVYGEATLEENLTFIANALGNKGNTSREVIRNYFLNDFIKDHIKIYKKRPIYWLYDSGKQNGFKALIYMHRYNADTTGNVRVEYLHRIQKVYERELERMQDTIDNSSDNKEISAANKRKEKLQKQLKETKEYDAKVAHLALSRIDIDLDDGVKVNYEKVQTTSDGTKLQILAKI